MPVAFPFDKCFCHFLCRFFSNAGALPGESACIPRALSIWGIVTLTAFSLLVGLQGLVAATLEIGSGLLHGFLDSCSLFSPFISTGSVVRFLYLFCFLLVHHPWSVFSVLVEILLPLFCKINLLYPQVELGLGLLDFFVDHALIPSLPQLCTFRPEHHVTSWRTMEPFALLACSTVMTWTYVDG